MRARVGVRARVRVRAGIRIALVVSSVALLAGVLLIGIATWRLVVAIALPEELGSEPSVVYRRDPVKLLAAERGRQAAVVELPAEAQAPPTEGD